MIDSNVMLNASPLFIFIQHLLALLGGLTLIFISMFLVYNYKNTKLLIAHADKFLEKFPLVSEMFLHKTLREQNIENNQEIHELNKRLQSIEEVILKAHLQRIKTMKGAIESDN